MKKIGAYWVPDIDAKEGKNLDRSKLAFEEGEGIQIKNLQRAMQWFTKFDLAIDGGANVGSWTRLLAEKFSVVHSFEPNHEAFLCLQRNIDEWGLSNKVVLHEQALSDFSGFVSVLPAGGKRTVTAKVMGSGPTEAITIDSLNLAGCSFIKLDIEGYEAKALLGATQTIKLLRPWILIENKKRRSFFFQKRSEAEKVLREWKYTLAEKIGSPPIDWLYKP
ncbi:MAG: FkbM family methyltransferase [Desulfobacterales bacterium]|nr:MAG: FkbM family methyltransferase [Desulfobacterales bacterium]